MNFINWCRRYVSLPFLALIVLFAYVIFFNENSYGHLRDLQHQITDLRHQIEADRDTMEVYRALNERLNTSTEEMERIARENYHLQRPNEDVYIFEEE